MKIDKADELVWPTKLKLCYNCKLYNGMKKQFFYLNDFFVEIVHH